MAMDGQPVRSSVALDVSRTLLALVFAGLVPFGFNLFVGRVYGPAALGEVSVVLGLALFLGQVPSTLGPAATKFMAEALGRGDDATARFIFQRLFVLNALLALLLTAGLLAAQRWIAAALHTSSGAVLLGAALVFTYAFYLYLKSVYYGTQQVGAYVWNEIVSDLAFFVILAAVYLAHASAWLLVPFVLNNAIFSAIALRSLRPLFQGFAWRWLLPERPVLAYWVLNGGGTAASLGRAALGATVAGLFLSHHLVGFYAAAMTLTAPLQLMPRALSLVLFAIMARLHGAGQSSSLRDLLDDSTEWLVLTLGTLSGLLIINAPLVLTRLFRHEYAQAAAVTQLVVFGAYLLIICGPAISALSSTTHIRVPTLASLLGLAASLVLWLTLTPTLGVDGTALGFLAGAILTGGIPALFAYRRLGMRPAPFLRAGVMLLALLAALQLGRDSLPASLLFLAVTIALYLRPILAAVRPAVPALGQSHPLPAEREE